MDEKRIIESLSPIERNILPHLSVDFSDLKQIAEKSETDETTALRAAEFLKNKKLVEIQTSKKKIVELDINGLYYLKKHLPERRLLDEIGKKKSILIKEVKNLCKLNDNEAKAAFGVLKNKAVISVSKGRIILTGKRQEITKKMLEEQFIEKLPLEVDKLKPEEKLALKNLLSRKQIVKIGDKKQVLVKLTGLGEKISRMDLDLDLIEQLTPEIIKKNSWKGRRFRRYDLTTQPPKIYGGKRHFVNQATDYAKKIWLEMGFKEMTGDLIQTSFWNFDALFTAQDHPVREMQDTFFIKNIEGELPEKDLVEQTKKAHQGELENEKSKGWQDTWQEDKSKKTLLRTHTTCLSAQTLKKIAENLEKNIPAKYFALGKCFRNETVDWSHGFEFNQTEGIVVDENANFRQLLGYLIEFFKKMGYEKIRIRPGYFPYTEPSLEIEMFHPAHKKWIELGGAGMFRPEVTIPIFGKHIPVLAWGPGFDRIIMEFFNINDLREMYKNDITKLREMKFWMK